jgi:hypothetical protein
METYPNTAGNVGNTVHPEPLEVLAKLIVEGFFDEDNNARCKGWIAEWRLPD